MVQIFADIPDDIRIHDMRAATLPPDWNRIDAPVMQLREMGTLWLLSNDSAIARVPSAVTPREFNYLLNPHHPDFSLIQSGTPEPFAYDARMKK